MGDFWVFGYGSLIWHPGFEFEEEHKAILYGYHRSLCINSWHYRGTKEVPGLVLGLDAGGSCLGIARRVSTANAENVLAYLRERELVSYVYIEKMASTRLANGRRINALTYVADRSNGQYAPPKSISETTEIVKRAVGTAGPNADYVKNTVTSLRQLEIRDKKLEAICDCLFKY